ncbi:hypothetical protein A3Q56_07942, partial [Intoshia linei]
MNKQTTLDFKFVKILGEGSFSTVVLAFSVKTHIPYAIKIVEKSHVIKHNKIEATMREKDMYSMMSYELIVKLVCTFQDANNLYFVLNYCHGGDLYTLLNHHKLFTVDVAQFYLAELVLCMEYLRSTNILHR